MKFLDTNIILRYLTRDDEQKAAACFALFQRVKQGKEIIITTETVIAEVVYVLSSRSQYGLSPEDIRSRLLPLLSLPSFKLPKKTVLLRALDLLVSYPKLDFEDVLSAAHMEQAHIEEIYSYDTDFDSISFVTREEPELVKTT